MFMVYPLISMPLPFFVYGTLRAGQTNAYLLRGAIVQTRVAKLGGAQMFDLGPYPMVIESAGAGADEVWGELVEIAPQRYDFIVQSLDRLEGVDGADPENPAALYRRLKRLVWVEEGAVECWVYFGRELLARRGQLVAGGDWVGRFERS